MHGVSGRRLRRLDQHLTPPVRRVPEADGCAQHERKPRLALVTTVWFAGKPGTADSPGEHGTPSHSVHMGDRFLTGWPMGGEVSAPAPFLHVVVE